MTASLLSKSQRRVTAILDGNPRIGAKIAVSGGGRCNLCNERLSPERYRGDFAFLSRVFERYGQRWLLDWFARRGVATRIEKDRQYFCVDGAESVNRLFRKTLSPSTVLLNEKVLSVSGVGPFRIETTRGIYRADRVVVASGGLSYPRLGAGDIGLRIAEAYGHPIVRPAPALVGMTLQPEQFFFKELSGVSLPVELRVAGRCFRDRLLFTHRGISGPAVLNASLWWEKGEIEIDFLPGFDQRLLRGDKKLSTLLPLPRRVARAFLASLELPDRAAGKLDASDREKLSRLTAYRFAPAGTFGYARAEVTRGGVATDTVDPRTMESLLQPGLYFLGEVLDVTGELGGFNFQWAFSSAAVCAEALDTSR